MGRANIQAAADLVGVDVNQVRDLKQFDGIAYRAATGKTEKLRTRKIPAKP